MSEFKGTPGPWTYSLREGEISVHQPGALTVAWLPADGLGRARHEADAILIAAAPELLAACMLWDQGFVVGEEFDAAQFLKWVNDNRRAARAAIALAIGGQS